MILVIYGAGGLGREVMTFARESKLWDDIIFIVDAEYISKIKEIDGVPVISPEELLDRYKINEIEILIALGEPTLRADLYKHMKSMGFSIASFIDPSVVLHEDTKLGEGVIIMRGCILSSNVVIGNNTVLSFGVIIGHDCTIGNSCYLAPRVSMGGFVTWSDMAFGGLGCTVSQGLAIGRQAIVGQGASVMKNVEDESVVMCTPARPYCNAGPRLVFNKE